MFRRTGFVIGLAAVALLVAASPKNAWAQTNPHCSKPPEVKQMSMMMLAYPVNAHDRYM